MLRSGKRSFSCRVHAINQKYGHLQVLKGSGDFPGGPVLELGASVQEGGFDPCSGEIRSHMLCGTTKKKKKKPLRAQAKHL